MTHMFPFRCNKSKSGTQFGFTLIEMLVVLVIMSITTTLLVEGLGTTWRNFEKLNSQQLVVNKGLLPKKWFMESIKGAQLYHPHRWVFTGFKESMSFVTLTAPGVTFSKPTHIVWFIREEGKQQSLYYRIDEGVNVKVATLKESYHFAYLNEGEWSETFQWDAARLPAAIKLTNERNDWVYAAPSAALKPEIPPSLGLYGDHGI